MRSHFLHLILYASLVAAFFAVLLRQRAGDRAKMFAIVWIAMVGGVLALAWVLFPLPR